MFVLVGARSFLPHTTDHEFYAFRGVLLYEIASNIVHTRQCLILFFQINFKPFSYKILLLKNMGEIRILGGCAQLMSCSLINGHLRVGDY